MKKYTNFAIVASFFGLWIDSFLDTKFQALLGFVLIFSFGILHGANDLLLIRKSNSSKPYNSTLRLLGVYILVVLLGIVLFFVMPALALLLFIGVSAYHFGEQQWQSIHQYFPKKLVVFFQFLYGLLILLLLFAMHPIEVASIIKDITKDSNLNLPITLVLYTCGLAFLALNVYMFISITKIRKKLLLELFHLLIFAIIFKSSSLIWGFAIYFILWHSIPSIIDQIRFIEGTFSMKHFRTYCKSAWLYWLISIVGIITLYSIFRETHLFNALFFSFLAAITFPHVIVITRMFLKKKTQKKPSHY